MTKKGLKLPAPVLLYFRCLFLAASAASAVCLNVSVYSHSDEAENDDCYESVSDVGESLLPDLVAQTDCLECAPETVAKVESECAEPYDVDESIHQFWNVASRRA